MESRVSVLVGTTKGVFVLTSDGRRDDFDVEGPYCDGWPINHVIGDPGSGRIWAAGGNDWEGAGVWRTGETSSDWSLTRLAAGEREAWITANSEEAAQFGFEPAGPTPFSGIHSVWSLARSGDTLYAGTKPANLFASTDSGVTWTRVDALADHPTRDDWQPGGAGLVLHTIVSDPADKAKLWIGISAAGIFATEDAGMTWERRIRRANVRSGTPGDDGGQTPDSEIGTCVHNLVRASGARQNGGDLLYQQNHQGVFRSPDGGRSWVEITAGLPSEFGFPIAVHPRDPETVWVLPLNGDVLGRFPPDAAAAVWKSNDGGESWEARRTGLPQKNCFFTVLRQAMAVDGGEPAGIYFGSNSGSVFASTDEGDTWREIASHLPTILSVETMQAA